MRSTFLLDSLIVYSSERFRSLEFGFCLVLVQMNSGFQAVDKGIEIVLTRAMEV